MNTGLLLHDDTRAALDTYIAAPAQAVLLQGVEGVGKYILARELAAQLLGIAPERLEQHAYAKIVEPDGTSINIAPVRELASFVALRVPGSAVVARVIIICDADTMTREAQNALLKLLEEPPERTVLLLTASHPKQLLPTILSRLQKVSVRLPAAEAVKQYLVGQGHAAADVDRAWLLCGGSMARALSLLQPDSEGSTSELALVRSVLAADQFTRLTLIDSELKDKQRAREFVRTVSAVASSSMNRPAQEEKVVLRWQKVLSAAYTAEQALGKNANTKLVLTELMLNL